jgi:aspartyl/asparaginyl-tRNA synthetase
LVLSPLQKVQVERIREIEVGQAKLAEAARWRRALQVERSELERLYSERVARLRTQEEALVAKVREQCREVERASFEQRQRVVEEDERMRTMHAVRLHPL